jgi:hypothetical protein
MFCGTSCAAGPQGFRTFSSLKSKETPIEYEYLRQQCFLGSSAVEGIPQLGPPEGTKTRVARNLQKHCRIQAGGLRAQLMLFKGTANDASIRKGRQADCRDRFVQHCLGCSWLMLQEREVRGHKEVQLRTVSFWTDLYRTLYKSCTKGSRMSERETG